MASSTVRNPLAPGPLRLMRFGVLGIILLGFGACSGGSCGDCGSFKQQKFPKKHYDKTVPRSGQVRVTQKGLDFLEQEVPNLIQQFRPQGLDFCVPKTEQSGATICHVDQCDSGSAGCQMSLSMEKTALEPSPPDTLELSVTIGQINEVLPFDYDLLVGTANCKADLHRDGASNDTPASVDAVVPIQFRIDQQSPTKNVTIEAGEIQADLSRLAIDIDSRGGFGDDIACEGADTIVKPFARGTIEDQLKSEINTAIQQIVREQTCQPCGNNQASCPSNSSCESFDDQKFCTRNSSGKCVAKPLGTQGRLLLASALGDFMETDDANVDLLARAADMADVDTGISIGLRTGFQQDEIRRCAPVDTDDRPSLSAIQPSMQLLSNEQPNTGDPFMVGIGIHQNTIEQALWTSWASGATCLRVGSSFNDSLNTTALKLFIPSIKNLAERKSPVYLRVTPQTAPTVQLGPNEVVKNGDTWELREPLLIIKWNNLDLHFYAFVENRYTRLYTTRIDLELPVALTTNGKGQLVPVVGNVQDAPKNIRVRNHRILAEEKKELKELVPTLLGTALPRLTGSLSDPIDLPSFYGYQLVVNKEDITAVDNKQFLALFADLKRATKTNSQLAELAPTIAETDIEVASTPDEIPEPIVHLQMQAGTEIGVSVPNEDVEYSYRVDDGFWSMYRHRDELTIQHPVLRLQGEHEIDVRARYASTPGTASAPVETTVSVDLAPPDVELRRSGKEAVIDTIDAVDGPEQMQYRFRVETRDGEHVADWSSWRKRPQIDLTSLGTERPVRLTVEARDRAGHVGRASDVFHTDPQVIADSSAPGAAGSNATGGSTGCAIATGEGGEPPSGLPWFLVLGVLGLFGYRRSRRHEGEDALAPQAGPTTSERDRPSCASGARSRRRRMMHRLLVFALVIAGLAISGCNNDISRANAVDTCEPACADWQQCEDGTCVEQPCSENADCAGNSICADGACAQPECSKSSDCSCPGDGKPQCKAGECVCEDPCPNGCPDMDEKDPLPLKWHGEYTSIDANSDGSVVAVSTYNRSYGDLMVGVLDGELKPTWYFPDGVPSDGEVVAGASGPRGGIQNKGSDVGTHTAIAVDDTGNLHVFYRSEESEQLKYARGTTSSGQYEFETTTVDDQAGSGLHTAAALGPEGAVHAFYAVKDVEVDYEGQTIAGSQLRHVGFPTDTGIDKLAPEPETVAIGGTRNPCVQCASGESCFTDDPACRESTNDCDTSCESGTKCYEGSCKPIFEEVGTPAPALMTGLYNEVVPRSDDLVVIFYNHVRQRVGWVTGTTGNWSDPEYLDASSGPYASGAVDSNGKLHLAFMDGASQTLRYRPPGDNGSETIRTGVRNTGREYLRAAVGEDVQLWLDSDEKPAVVFQDATRHRFLRANRTGSNTWNFQTLSKPTDGGNYVGARGFYSGAAITSSGPGSGVAAEYIIDQQAEPPEGHLEFRRLQ